MIRGMYSAASALQTAAANQEVVAENLAHAATPGYRRHGLLFAAYDALGQTSVPGAANSPIPQVGTAGTFTQFESGPLQQTRNPLDVAITGNAFFAVDGPRGPLFTRNGTFQLNADGQLQTASGLRVRGQGGGSITIPRDARNIVVDRDGIVYADNAEAGRLQLATFPDLRALRRAGSTLFEGPAPQTPPPGTVRVEQGYREGANVQVVNEMVSMMLGMRYYEAAQRALRSLSDTVSQITRPDAAA